MLRKEFCKFFLSGQNRLKILLALARIEDYRLNFGDGLSLNGQCDSSHMARDIMRKITAK